MNDKLVRGPFLEAGLDIDDRLARSIVAALTAGGFRFDHVYARKALIDSLIGLASSNRKEGRAEGWLESQVAAE